MPYKGDGYQLSVRIPNALWKDIEELFGKRNQSHLSKNDKILTLLKECLGKNECKKDDERRGYNDRRKVDLGGDENGIDRRKKERRRHVFYLPLPVE